MYMCVKLLLGDLNPGPYPSHSTSTYTCGVTITPRVYGSMEVLTEFKRPSLDKSTMNLGSPINIR